MTSPSEPGATPGGARRWLGAAAGLIAGMVAVGISQLVAGFTGPTGAPVAAVGGVAIDFTPPPVKNFAISAFGTHDKTVLLTGVVVVLAALAVAAGLAAVHRLGWGLAGVGVLALIGVAAALSRPGSGAADALPTLIGAAAAAYALTRMIRALPGPAAAPAVAARPAQSGPPSQPRTTRTVRPARTTRPARRAARSSRRAAHAPRRAAHAPGRPASRAPGPAALPGHRVSGRWRGGGRVAGR
jgi:hypothetical protein